MIETHVSAQLIHHKRSTKEGENISYDMEELNLNTQTHFGKSEFDDDSTAEDVEPSKVKADKELCRYIKVERWNVIKRYDTVHKPTEEPK